MMCKLAFRNVKRMAKDYIVYFMTMAVVTALMFSFHTLLFSKDVQNLFQMDAMMSVMTGLATAFIVPIIAWLINYMVRFILEKRSREFGIYLLVGVKKKEIARLYFTENLLLGAGNFLDGFHGSSPFLFFYRRRLQSNLPLLTLFVCKGKAGIDC